VISYLQSLAGIPGVEYVLLVSHDGVPIAHAGGHGEGEREQSLAALAASWLNDISMAVAPLTWAAPRRVCLRAARGTLVLRRSDSACLVVVLGRDAAPEDVRLPMDGVLARVERARTSRKSPSSARDASGASTPPAGPIASRTAPAPVEEDLPPAPHRGDSPGT
jgi:predicted regulator of Ras-like GTPase activity (Roadblock/LC7/MglB family)